MRLALPIGAALLAASTALYAQQTDDKAARRQALKDAHSKALKACEGAKDEARRACLQRELCAQSKDPKACQERIAKGKDTVAKARKACDGKPEAERRACMQRELCAQSKDPARCEAHAREATAMRDKAREACKDKPADERRACMREQLGRKPRA
ncbi:MAG: hypothetical protein ACREUS_06580 [Burkholderiales bacterium]